jgi:hypothetical protein
MRISAGRVKEAKLGLTLASAGFVSVVQFARRGVKLRRSRLVVKPFTATGGPGAINVRLRLTGSAKATLGRKGKLEAVITFTPTGGCEYEVRGAEVEGAVYRRADKDKGELLGGSPGHEE